MFEYIHLSIFAIYFYLVTLLTFNAWAVSGLGKGFVNFVKPVCIWFIGLTIGQVLIDQNPDVSKYKNPLVISSLIFLLVLMCRYVIEKSKKTQEK